MGSQRQANLAGLHRGGVLGDLFDVFGEEVSAFQKSEGEILSESGVAGIARCGGRIRRIRIGLHGLDSHANLLAALRARRSAPSTGSITCGFTSARASSLRSSL